MSSNRNMIRGLRKNIPYQEMVRVCKEWGLTFEVVKPSGRGHPRLHIYRKGKKVMCRPLSNSPGKCRPLDMRHNFINELKAKGVQPCN